MAERRSFYEEKVYDLSAELPTEGQPKRVLMLEDDQQFAELLRTFLESIGYQVTIVPDGASGVRQILAQDFEIILCDLLMPHLPGDLFYMAVERSRPHLCQRFVFMSGHKADPRWDAFIRRIRGCVLWKPFHMNDLQKAFEKVIQKGQASTSS